ncbi:toll/interleukin-1 receptor domain-containing protein [Streptomyces sp. NPDC051956]|uniref:toll/interleukin-1 receptor domain-containing protein n=1 Tax=Streptomyces sp. NPDC051956 TaxID=3365677 RepID=UPI0037D5B0D2
MLIVPRSLVTRRLASGGRPVRPEESENRFTYDAFISYSRAADGDLARVLQHGLHTFAKPWYRLRALRVFRDEGSLAPGSQLWGSLQEAMDASHFFVLLACEQSARAPWVEQEVAYWCTHRGVENLVIVLTDPPADGSRQPPGMAWDADLGDFDWQRTTALPRCLKGRFRQEPNAVLLGRARTKPELSLRDPEFRTAVATLAAPLRGVPKDRLIGEDVRQYRRTRRHVLLTIAGLVALVVFAAFSAVTAVQQRDTARDQTALAEGRQYAALSRNASDPYTALAYAIAAEQRAAPHLSEARGAFAEAVRGLDAWEARLVGEVPAKAVFDTAVRWSRDGSQIWVADREGGVSRWNMREGKAPVPYRKPSALRIDGKVPESVQWSRDDRSLLLTRDHKSPPSYAVRDNVSGKTTAGPKALPDDYLDLSALQFAPRGDTLAVASKRHGIRLRDVRTGRLLRKDPLPRSRPKPGAFAQLAWSSDGRRLCLLEWKSLKVWDVRRGKLLWAERTASEVLAPTWSPDGRRLATGTRDGQIVVRDGATGKVTQASTARLYSDQLYDGVREISWSPDGARMAVAGLGGNVRLWDPGTGEPVGPPLDRDTNRSLTSGFAWSPDGRFLAATFISDASEGSNGPASSVLRVWEVAPPPPREARLPGPSDVVPSVAWSPDGRRIAAGSGDGTVWVWDARTRKPDRDSPQQPLGPMAKVMGVVWEPRGRRLLRVDGYGLLPLSVPGDASTGKHWWSSGGTRAAAWSPDGTRVVSGTYDSKVRIWDARTGKRTRRQPQDATANSGTPPTGKAQENRQGVLSVAWSHDSRHAAAVLPDGSLHLSDAASGEPWGAAPQASRHLARSMAWSPDGTRIAVGGVDGTIRLWDGKAGTPLPTVLKSGDTSVEALAWSPDSTRLASGDGAGTIRLWEPGRGLPPQLREGAHDTAVTSLSWSPDGTRLVSAGKDGAVRLWQGSAERDLCRLLDAALHRTRSTPELTGATGVAARVCADPARIRNYPVLPLKAYSTEVSRP